MKCMNCDTWDEVEKRFRNYAEEKRLIQITTLHFTNDYCQAAFTAKTSESSDCFMVQHNDAKLRGYVICADPMMVTAVNIMQTRS